MIQIKLSSFDYTGNLSVYIYRTGQQGDLEFFYPEKGLWEKVASDGESPKQEQSPSFKIPGRFAMEFREAMAQALANDGFEPASRDGLRGKLEATQLHLRDMQEIVKQTLSMILNKYSV